MSEDSELRDACWKLYLEHCTHARHHETQRSTVAASILAIATALIGLVTFDKEITSTDLPLTLLLTLLGAFGALFSAKQYERASFHTERSRHYRNAIDATLVGQPLIRLKQAADARHHDAFPRLEQLRLNKFWVLLYVFIAAIGITLSMIAVYFSQKA